EVPAPLHARRRLHPRRPPCAAADPVRPAFRDREPRRALSAATRRASVPKSFPLRRCEAVRDTRHEGTAELTAASRFASLRAGGKQFGTLSRSCAGQPETGSASRARGDRPHGAGVPNCKRRLFAPHPCSGKLLGTLVSPPVTGTPGAADGRAAAPAQALRSGSASRGPPECTWRNRPARARARGWVSVT